METTLWIRFSPDSMEKIVPLITDEILKEFVEIDTLKLQNGYLDINAKIRSTTIVQAGETSKRVSRDMLDRLWNILGVFPETSD